MFVFYLSGSSVDRRVLAEVKARTAGPDPPGGEQGGKPW